MSRPMRAFETRLARPADAGAIASCACEAYLHYVERIGRQPGPMLVDYAQAIACHDVRVAVRDSRVHGFIVLAREGSEFWLDNIAVRPASWGLGLGTTLLLLAESVARSGGFASLRLYTHELMTENRAWYERRGFREEERCVRDGYPRACFRKPLAQ